MSAEQMDLAMRYSAAWANHDPDAIVAMHTEDTVFHMHGMAEPAIGAAATRDAIHRSQGHVPRHGHVSAATRDEPLGDKSDVSLPADCP